MPGFKISMNFSQIIEAQDEEEAVTEFWECYKAYDEYREPTIKRLKDR
jgi:hypothetical protein